MRLGDIARVQDGVENERAAGWANGERSVILVIRRQPGANIIDVIDRVKALLPTLASSISPAIRVDVALDRSQTIRASSQDSARLTMGLRPRAGRLAHWPEPAPRRPSNQNPRTPPVHPATAAGLRAGRH